VKAGLDDKVILSVIAKQGGNFSVDPDSVVSLKQAGVKGRVISAMINGAPSQPTALGREAPSSGQLQSGGILNNGTRVRLRLKRNRSSATAKTGETVDFEVLDEVVVGGQIVIERGSVVIGAVTDVEAKRQRARGGKLDVALEYTHLVNGEKVALR
jgi:hypothetical protein